MIDAHVTRSGERGVGQARERHRVRRRPEAAPVEVAAELAAGANLQPLAIDDDFHLVESLGRPRGPHRRRSADTDDDQVGARRGDFMEWADAVAAFDRGRLRRKRRAAARREG
jgi:hypothetical protein